MYVLSQYIISPRRTLVFKSLLKCIFYTRVESAAEPETEDVCVCAEFVIKQCVIDV